jgi:hypothetical protein
MEMLDVALRKRTKVIAHEGKNALPFDLIYLVELLRETRNVHNKRTDAGARGSSLFQAGTGAHPTSYRGFSPRRYYYYYYYY